MSTTVDGRSLRRVTGWAGIGTAVLSLAELPLYFWYSGPPPDGIALAHTLLAVLALGCMVAFMNGIRYLVAERAPAYGWVGGLASTAGLMWVTVALVATALEAGTEIASSAPVDGTIAADGSYLLYGSISRMLVALFLLALGVASSRTGLLPRWAVRVSYVLGTVQILFLPSMFFGNMPADFYAANGWGTTASIGGIDTLWLLVLSVCVLRSALPSPGVPKPESATGTKQRATTG